MQPSIRAGAAGLLIALAAAPAARAADVTVRAESFAATVLPQTTVSNTGPNALANGKSCPSPIATGRTAAGALERATGGDWDGSSFSFGLTVERILSTDLGAFGAPTFWNFDVDNSAQQVGICDVDPAAGDEILFYEACASASATACFTGTPLGLTAPATATVGEPFTVSVVEFDDSRDPAPSAPAASATIAGGGQSAETAANGTARFAFEQAGPVTLVATKGRQVRDSATVDVRAVPAYPIPSPAPTAAPPGDTTAPVSRIRSPRDGRVFKRRGPRQLRAAIAGTDGPAAVRLALTRRVGKRCTAFRGASERFTKARCGAHPRFDVGPDRRLSFLLPSRLRKGKYVFDVIASDAAGNVEALERGRNRVVFRVR